MAASPALRRFRIVLWSLVVIAAIGATALYFIRPPAPPAAGVVSGATFALDSTKGGTFTQADLKGTPSLVFFGYTFCPDVCPTTMAEIAEYKKELGLTASDVRTIFVTVDPERDTKQALADYLGSFDPDAIGLVGDAAATARAKAAFGVESENGPKDASGNYVVSHTASVFLMGRDGEFEGTIAYDDPKAGAIAKIKRLVQG